MDSSEAALAEEQTATASGSVPVDSEDHTLGGIRSVSEAVLVESPKKGGVVREIKEEGDSVPKKRKKQDEGKESFSKTMLISGLGKSFKKFRKTSMTLTPAKHLPDVPVPTKSLPSVPTTRASSPSLTLSPALQSSHSAGSASASPGPAATPESLLSPTGSGSKTLKRPLFSGFTTRKPSASLSLSAKEKSGSDTDDGAKDAPVPSSPKSSSSTSGSLKRMGSLRGWKSSSKKDKGVSDSDKEDSKSKTKGESSKSKDEVSNESGRSLAKFVPSEEKDIPEIDFERRDRSSSMSKSRSVRFQEGSDLLVPKTPALLQRKRKSKHRIQELQDKASTGFKPLSKLPLVPETAVAKKIEDFETRLQKARLRKMVEKTAEVVENGDDFEAEKSASISDSKKKAAMLIVKEEPKEPEKVDSVVIPEDREKGRTFDLSGWTPKTEKPDVKKIDTSRLTELETVFVKKAEYLSTAKQHLGREVKRLSITRRGIVSMALEKQLMSRGSLTPTPKSRKGLGGSASPSPSSGSRSASVPNIAANEEAQSLLKKFEKKFSRAKLKSAMFQVPESAAVGSGDMDVEKDPSSKDSKERPSSRESEAAEVESLASTATAQYPRSPISMADVGSPASTLSLESRFEDDLKSIGGDDVEESAKEEMYPEFAVVVDSILEDSAAMTDFSMDNHPVFKQMDVTDPKYRTLIKILAEAFSLNTNFTSISLKNCNLTDEFLEELCGWIKKGKFLQVQELNLDGNLLTSKGLIEFAKCLMIGFEEEGIAKHKQMQLRDLSLMHQKGWVASAEAEKVLAQTLRVNTRIVRVKVRVTNEDVKILIEKFLQRNAKTSSGPPVLTPLETRIRKISINADNSEDNDTLVLEDDFAFRMMSRTEQLKLAVGLRTNRQLKTLRLVQVDLTDDFCFPLASSLVDNVTLEVLDLSKNRISAIGLEALSEGIRTNRGLKQFHFMDQYPPLEMDDDLQMEIALALSKCQTLITCKAPFTNAAAKLQLDTALARNCLAELARWDLASPTSGGADSDDD